jgi:hypothetical protein
MANKTQKYAQMKLEFAQQSVDEHQIKLGLRDVEYNTIRVIDRGVNIVKESCINARRAYQKKSGVHMGEQEYLYPLKDKKGESIKDKNNKVVKVLLPFGVMKKLDPDHAEKLRDKLAMQAEGLQETVRQMDEC